MDGFKNIEIKNFKGIDHLKIDDFSRVNILLIDEIENGLHYSAYKKLWEAIFALATTTNKQVFVTTHSKENLYGLSEMLEEHTEYQQEMRLYTLANTPIKGHQAYKYTFDGLNGACENDVELRWEKITKCL